MKTVKFVFPALALVFALAGAFISQAQSEMPNVLGYYQIEDNPATETIDETECRQLEVNEADCPETGTVACTITLSGVQKNAHSARSQDGLTCITPFLFRSN